MGDSQTPFRQGATVFGGNAGHHSGRRSAASLAPPGAPFPVWGDGKRDRRCPRRAKQPGGAALAKAPSRVIPGRAPPGSALRAVRVQRRASPESTTTGREIETETERYGKCRGYGFRPSL